MSSTDPLNQLWHERAIEGEIKEYILKPLQCGTTYQLRLIPINSAGKGEPSILVTTRTQGTGTNLYTLLTLMYEYLNV